MTRRNAVEWDQVEPNGLYPKFYIHETCGRDALDEDEFDLFYDALYNAPKYILAGIAFSKHLYDLYDVYEPQQPPVAQLWNCIQPWIRTRCPATLGSTSKVPIGTR